MKTFLTACFSACVFLIACNQAPQAPSVDMDALKGEIQPMEDAYAAGMVARNADAVAAYYSDDAISYGANAAPRVGKAAIRQHIAEMIQRDTIGVVPEFHILDLYAEGDHVTEFGSWTDKNPAGEVVDEGTYVSVFEKRDGKWVCIRDMAVSSKAKDSMKEEMPAEGGE